MDRWQYHEFFLIGENSTHSYETGNRILAYHDKEKRNGDSQRNCGGILKNDSMVAVKMNMG